MRGRWFRIFVVLAVANAALFSVAAIAYATVLGEAVSVATLVVNAPAALVSILVFGDEQDERLGLPVSFAANYCLCLPWLALVSYAWMRHAGTASRRSESGS